MGSSASKQAGRNLAKNVSESSLSSGLKRTKIDPLAQVHKHEQEQAQRAQLQQQGRQTQQQKPSFRSSNSLIRGPTNGSTAQRLTPRGRAEPDYSTKDGMDPDFGAKAMSLGAVTLTEREIKIDRSNLAIQTLAKRQELEKLGTSMRHQQKDKTLLDPRTIGAVLTDLENGVSREQVTKMYGLHEGFVEQLNYGVIKVARTRVGNVKTVDDLNVKKGRDKEEELPSGRKKHSNELQAQLDKLLS